MMNNTPDKDALILAKKYAWDFAQHVQYNTAQTKAVAEESLAALTAALSAAPAQPQGPRWKWVPVEPTEEMDAAARAECHRMRGVIDPVVHIWDVMMANVPVAPAQQASEQPAMTDAETWQPVTKAGQVKVGDKLRFNIGDNKYSEKVKLILDAGTDKEEVIYNKSKNFYFITAMVLSGFSNHKNVEFLSAASEKTEGGK